MTSENGVTFHSVDSRKQEMTSPEFKHYLEHPPTGGVNSTVLAPDAMISRGETPEYLHEKAVINQELHEPDKLFPVDSSKGIAIHHNAKNGTVFLKVQTDSPEARKLQSFLNDQKLQKKQSTRKSAEKSAVSKLPATTSLNIEIKESTKQKLRVPAGDEKDRKSVQEH